MEYHSVIAIEDTSGQRKTPTLCHLARRFAMPATDQLTGEKQGFQMFSISFMSYLMPFGIIDA